MVLSNEIGKVHVVTLEGQIFDIQRYSVNDGPGIRTIVFLKGCPLRCLWCCNPESQKPLPQLFYFGSLCTRCYRCVNVCPTGATSKAADGSIIIDRQLCQVCGKCVAECPSEARVITGKTMTVEEVLEVVKKDAIFYRNSDGGVTLSGGEPTSQPEFSKELLRRCQESGLDTAIETSGYVDWQKLKEILEYVDLVLFDIKHMDSSNHRQLTGVGNELILANAARIAGEGKPLIIRVPLIPGCNDSEENIEALIAFMKKLRLSRVDLLPYHRLGVGKYERLGMEYDLKELESYKEERSEVIKKRLEAKGLQATIG